MKRSEDFKADLLAELRRDADYAAEYLSAAKADSTEAFLVALRELAEARQGMRKVAKAAKVNRESLYRALSKKGNPSISTLDAVLEVLGIELKFVVRRAVDWRGRNSKGVGSATGPGARKQKRAAA
ncbi:MAG: addiction module antidote protein [Candidatus Acidiferrales bacterium]